MSESEPEQASSEVPCSQLIKMHDNERDIGSQTTLILKIEVDPAVYPAYSQMKKISLYLAFVISFSQVSYLYQLLGWFCPN